jgi:tRNA(fMet)-specific endonuclease VapC
MSHGYLLDTNIIAALAKNPSGPVSGKISDVGQDAICTSIIVACEIHYGLLKKESHKLTAQMTAIMHAIDVVDLPKEVDSNYGDIRLHLERQGQPIGPNDLLIAAHARAAGLAIVTGNDREFKRVPDLKVENWLIR